MDTANEVGQLQLHCTVSRALMPSAGLVVPQHQAPESAHPFDGVFHDGLTRAVSFSTQVLRKPALLLPWPRHRSTVPSISNESDGRAPAKVMTALPSSTLAEGVLAKIVPVCIPRCQLTTSIVQVRGGVEFKKVDVRAGIRTPPLASSSHHPTESISHVEKSSSDKEAASLPGSVLQVKGTIRASVELVT